MGLTANNIPSSHSSWAWGSSCLHGATSTVALQLENSCTQTHVKPNKPRKRSHLLNSRVRFPPCLPRSRYQGHRDHSGLCFRLWRMWSSSCQISLWTWNLRPPTRRIKNDVFIHIITPALPLPPPYLSGGVADSVQGKQVGGVRHGVVLGDGDGQRTLQVLRVLIDLHLAAQTWSSLWNHVTIYGGEWWGLCKC